MSANLSYIHKAEGALQDIVTGGGYMLREQVERFVEILIEPSKLLGLVSTELMEAQEVEIDKMGFTGQVLHPAEENTSLPTDERATALFDKTVLSAKPFKAEAVMSFRMVRNAINRGQFIPTVISLLGKAARRDIEKVILRGDTSLLPTTQQNRMLRKMDGILKKAVSHVHDAAGAPLTGNIFDAMAKAMPVEYYEDDKLEFFSGKNACIDYRRSIANRMTPGGDQARQSRTNSDHHGTPVVSIPLFPQDLTYNAVQGYTSALLCDPKNIIVGFQTDMEVFQEVHARAGQFIVVMYFDFDVTYRHEPAVVKAINISAR